MRFTESRCRVLRVRYWVLGRQLLVAALVAVAAPVFAEGEVPSRPVEIRGIWMDRNSIPKTEQGIRDMIRSYARAGINLVHPEVIFNGYASYKSNVLPQKDLYPGIDMLGILIDESHKHGIEVHPWVWVFRTGNVNDKGGILTQHPDWAMKDRHGSVLTDNDSYWLSPCIRGVRRMLLDAYVEMVRRYPVDGVELDYVRYPSTNHGYEPACREKYQARHGIDPIDIEPFTKELVDWHLWREEQVNSFVKEAAQLLRAARPGIKISAAVASYPDQSRLNYLQDWKHWAANKWVDFLSPMDYTANNENFTNRVTDSYSKLGELTLLAPGIGIYTQKGTQTMLEQIDITRSLPVNGSTIFATAYFTPEHMRVLAEGPWRTKAELPFRQPIAKARDLVAYTEKQLKDARTPEDVRRATDELGAAQNILRYTNFMMTETAYVVPARPPMSIPEVIVPIPEVRVPMVSEAPKIDGSLDDVVWRKAVRIDLEYTALGDAASQPTEVLIAYDAQNLYVGYRCAEPSPDRIRATVTAHDGHVFYEDSAEVFLDVEPESDSGHYQLATNALGTRYDARIYDTSFSPEWQSAASIVDKECIVEMSIPFRAFGMSTPTVGTMWRANFCRNRFAGDPKGQNMCWSPTYGSFHTPIRFGRIIFSGEVR